MSVSIKVLARASLIVISTFGVARAADDTVIIPCVCEASGAGAAVGGNFRDGAHLAVDEINAAGGILGKKIVMEDMDTATDPQTSKVMVQKAIDGGAYAIMGTVFSGSTVVSMLAAQQAGVPQFTGGEAPAITAKGNGFIFRTAMGEQKGVPALTSYFKDTVKAKSVAVEWVNNDFGKGGHQVFLDEMKKVGIAVTADISTEQGQADFAADVAKIKDSKADAVFVYINEEESARFLKEAKKQGMTTPLIGEVTLTASKVIELAGDASEGAIAHVGLTPMAPIPAIQAFAEKFNKKYNRITDHNGIKGYIGVYAIKYATELNGKFDKQALADKLHGLTLDAAKYPGMLLTTSWDASGELSRDSFMTAVKGGKQIVIGTRPAN